jgi:uncharacterized protein with GYD domain
LQSQQSDSKQKTISLIKNQKKESMKVVTIGTYSQAGLAALADATYEQRRAAMDELYSACGGKIIDYFFCDGDADFIAIAEVPSREVHKGMLNNALATGSTTNLRSLYEIDLSTVTESQRKARDAFKPITG